MLPWNYWIYCYFHYVCSIFSERELRFTLAICYRRSVRLSVVCQSVTFVHPTQPADIFSNVSSPFGTLAIR